MPLLFVAGGDVLWDRGIARVVALRGWDHPLGGLRPLLRSAGFSLANLECPLTDRLLPLPKEFTFRSDPTAAQALARGGIRLVTLANNHTMDQGRGGLVDTMAALDAAGVAWCGAAPRADRALLPTVIDVGALRVAFVGCSVFPPEGYIWSPQAPGPAPAGAASLRAAVRLARIVSDIVVVTVHWGPEFDTVASEQQRRLARAAVDAGAAVVVGHHPHVIQGVELYRGAVIAYSLGNLVFDQWGSPETRRGALLCGRLEAGRLRDAFLLPVIQDAGRPTPPTPSPTDSAAIVEHVARTCRRSGTAVRVAPGGTHCLLTDTWD